jgi:hypothetical protein
MHAIENPGGRVVEIFAQTPGESMLFGQNINSILGVIKLL